MSDAIESKDRAIEEMHATKFEEETNNIKALNEKKDENKLIIKELEEQRKQLCSIIRENNISCVVFDEEEDENGMLIKKYIRVKENRTKLGDLTEDSVTDALSDFLNTEEGDEETNALLNAQIQTMKNRYKREKAKKRKLARQRESNL